MRNLPLFTNAIVIFVCLSLSACLKDTKEPQNHINDVRVSLTGIWTQSSGVIKYYDATNSQVYSSSVPLANLEFREESTILISADSTAYSGNYSIVTNNLVDYIQTTTPGLPDHRYAIQSLSARQLTLTETTQFAAPDTLNLAFGKIGYTRAVQTNKYLKKDLPEVP